ncbi:hypothetical protein, partial [Klebsiella pneumoniae]|uniref:hypothetical protein n=1 Tax=Klebsiella pneumoniae TaxID=573 RepID=UPI002362F211
YLFFSTKTFFFAILPFFFSPPLGVPRRGGRATPAARKFFIPLRAADCSVLAVLRSASVCALQRCRLKAM